MSQRRTFRPRPPYEHVKAGMAIALGLTNLFVIPFVIMMAANVVHDVQNQFDVEATDPKCQSAVPPVISFILFPLLLYLLYFISFGKTTTQTRIAGWSVVLIVTASLAKLVYALKPRWPGGYPDLEMVFDAILTLFFCGWLLFGTIFRQRIIVRSKKRKYPHCRRCGYNLTGLTVARCPECGIPFDSKLLGNSGQSDSAGINRHGGVGK